jgi:hypothetical protein
MEGEKTYLAQETQDLETPIVDFEGGGAGEAVEAAPQGGDEVVKDLGHGGDGVNCPRFVPRFLDWGSSEGRKIRLGTGTQGR